MATVQIRPTPFKNKEDTPLVFIYRGWGAIFGMGKRVSERESVESTNYEDKFTDIMRYGRAKMRGNVQIENESDMRNFLEETDDLRSTGGKPRFSDRFIAKLIETDGARRIMARGSTGTGDRVKVLPVKARQYRERGYDVREYRKEKESRYVVVQKDRRGKVHYRDTQTGRFVRFVA